MKRTIIIILLCAFAVYAASCHQETPQDKIKKAVATIQQAVERKDVKTIIGFIAKNYTDPRGNSYETLKSLLLVYFYRYPKISVYIPNLDVIADDTSAKAVFQAVLTGRGGNDSAAAILPESLGVYAFEVAFRKESGEWIIYSATWERLGDAPETSVRQ